MPVPGSSFSLSSFGLCLTREDADVCSWHLGPGISSGGQSVRIQPLAAEWSTEVKCEGSGFGQIALMGTMSWQWYWKEC